MLERITAIVALFLSALGGTVSANDAWRVIAETAQPETLRSWTYSIKGGAPTKSSGRIPPLIGPRLTLNSTGSARVALWEGIRSIVHELPAHGYLAWRFAPTESDNNAKNWGTAFDAQVNDRFKLTVHHTCSNAHIRATVVLLDSPREISARWHSGSLAAFRGFGATDQTFTINLPPQSAWCASELFLDQISGPFRFIVALEVAGGDSSGIAAIHSIQLSHSVE